MTASKEGCEVLHTIWMDSNPTEIPRIMVGKHQ